MLMMMMMMMTIMIMVVAARACVTVVVVGGGGGGENCGRIDKGIGTMKGGGRRHERKRLYRQTSE